MMPIAHTYTTSLSAACKDVRAAVHNYKLFTLNCKLILTPPTEGFRNNNIRADEAR